MDQIRPRWREVAAYVRQICPLLTTAASTVTDPGGHPAWTVALACPGWMSLANDGCTVPSGDPWSAAPGRCRGRDSLPRPSLMPGWGGEGPQSAGNPARWNNWFFWE